MTLTWTPRSECWYMASGHGGTTYHLRFDDATARWTLATQPVACDTHTPVERSPKLTYLMDLAQWREDGNV